MLFNSYTFIFLFLPVTAIIFFQLSRHSHQLAATWLTAASLFFYGWWNPTYIALLLVSILFNFATGVTLARGKYGNRQRKAILAFGIACDLALLGYYKYANFFIENLGALTGSGFGIEQIVLPLGISFFTFTQIAFLVDAFQGKVREYNFIHYSLFVTYFPHLIAGPILHHGEMMPQFAQRSTYRLDTSNIAVGLTIFFIGLFKKAVLADGIAPYGNPIFMAASHGESVQLLQAWGGVLAYTLQLYFDFSGYSDMAIGLSRLFGVALPLNFDSPYKAVNIIDFWRRWHMTLSRFLRDYLYIPLGGNRKGPARRYLNLAVTMLLGGLWHGASWNFVVWGGLHGIYLTLNHAWLAFRRHLGHDLAQSSANGRLFGRALTFVAVVIAWVFFRAPDIASATNLLSGMAGISGASLPVGVAAHLGPFAKWSSDLGVTFTPGGGSQFVLTYTWVVGLLGIAFFFPNTQELMCRYQPALDYKSRVSARASWTPGAGWAVAIGVMAAAGIFSLSHVSEFLYFQF